jgi:hypothetical protein
MFEFIGIITTCWVAFIIIRKFFRAKSLGSSEEFRIEATHIATKDLLVPISYYRYLTRNKIESIKQSALLLRDSNDDFNNCSWPRLIAFVIYGEYHQDCQQWQYGNPTTIQRFEEIGITSDMVIKELERDGSAVIYANM